MMVEVEDDDPWRCICCHAVFQDADELDLHTIQCLNAEKESKRSQVLHSSRAASMELSCDESAPPPNFTPPLYAIGDSSHSSEEEEVVMRGTRGGGVVTIIEHEEEERLSIAVPSLHQTLQDLERLQAENRSELHRAEMKTSRTRMEAEGSTTTLSPPVTQSIIRKSPASPPYTLTKEEALEPRAERNGAMTTTSAHRDPTHPLLKQPPPPSTASTMGSGFSTHRPRDVNTSLASAPRFNSSGHHPAPQQKKPEPKAVSKPAPRSAAPRAAAPAPAPPPSAMTHHRQEAGGSPPGRGGSYAARYESRTTKVDIKTEVKTGRGGSSGATSGPPAAGVPATPRRAVAASTTRRGGGGGLKPIPVTSEPLSRAKMIFCTQCGKRYGAGANFCGFCGTRRGA